MTTAKSAVQDVARAKAHLAGKSLNRVPGDPTIEQARAKLIATQQRAGTSAVLDAVESHNDNAPPDIWVRGLKVPGVPIGVVLLETVEIIAYLVRLSDRPDQMLAALREQLIAPDNTD